MKWINILLVLNFVFIALGRPNIANNDERSDEENEYEAEENSELNDERLNDQSAQNDQSASNDQSAPNQNDQLASKEKENNEEIENTPRRRRVLDFGENSYLQRLAEARSARGNRQENISGITKYGNKDIVDEKIDDDISKSLPQTLAKRGMFNKYVNKISGGKQDKYLNNDREKYNIQNFFHKRTDGQGHNTKNLDETLDNQNDNTLSGQKSRNENKFKNDKPVYDSATLESKDYDQILHDLKEPSLNKMENLNNEFSNEETLYNRDRRNIPEKVENNEFQSSTFSTEENDSEKDNNEEAMIKKHIKRLSGDELDDLLKSLSDTKRELLKKIMNNDKTEHSEVMKRDITKKAEAVVESNINENNLVDPSKNECSGKSISDKNGTVKITERKDVSKESESLQSSDNNAETIMTNSKKLDNSSSSPSTDNKVFSTTDTSTQINKVNEQIKEKREAYNDEKKYDDLISNNEYKLNDQNYVCSQDEGMNNVIDSEFHNYYNKREAIPEIYDNDKKSIMSLEESFPNSNSYDGAELNLPLVRVKRNNNDVIKKRSAALLPEAKASYFPYRTENEDEDNDEGNEFDDDGFYDRTSNIAKNNGERQAEEESFSNEYKIHDNIIESKDPLKIITSTPNRDPLESNNIKLGSDTDNVLSSEEGINDNLMFNSGSRSRRSPLHNLETAVTSISSIDNNDIKNDQITDNQLNYSLYQENDALGSMQKNYEEGTGRFKRIRNVNNIPTFSNAA